MKKVLILISMLMAMVMLMPMVPVQVFATEVVSIVTTNSDGTKTYTVNEFKQASQDGAVGKNEYSVTANLSAPVAASSTVSFDALTTIPETDTLRSEEMSISFSHTAGKIYIGIYDKSGTANILNGYALRLGFDEKNPNNTVGMVVRQVDYTSNGSKTTVANLNKTRTEYPWSQGTRYGMARSNGDYKWNVLTCPNGEFANYTFGDTTAYSSILYHNDTKDTTYPITAMTMLREDADGGNITLGNSGRVTSGQHYTYWEIEIDKAKLLSFYNGMYEEGEQFATLPETMMFSLQQMEVNPSTTTNTFYMWNGSFDSDHATKDHAMMAYNYDKVVFRTPCGENECDFSAHNTADAYLAGTKLPTVTGYNKAEQDGAIGKDEYSITFDYSTPVAASKKISFDSLTTLPTTDNLRSEEMSISFSHTADKIYVGIYDKSGTANILNGYALRLGFDEENPNNIVGITVRMADYTANGSKTTVAKLNKTYSEYPWAQGARLGMVRSNGSYVWNCLFGPSSSTLNPAPSTYKASDSKYTSILCHADTKDTTYPITAMTMLREDADGGNITLGSSGRITSGQHYTYYEIEIDKQRLLNFYNGMYEEGEQFATLPETMMFSLQQMEVNPSTTTEYFYVWNGSFNEDHATKSNAFEAYNYEKVVFKAPTAEETVTSYYHSCKNCGAIGATTFKVDANNNVIYDQDLLAIDADGDNIPDNRVVVDGFVPTCGEGYSYYKTCTCGAFVENEDNVFEDEDSRDLEVHSFGHVIDEEYYVQPTVYELNGYSSATPDGAIGADEYSVTAKFKNPVAASSAVSFNALKTIPRTDALRSEEMAVSFSHTEDKIYIGLYDKSGTSNILNGYALRLGFDESNTNNTVGIAIRMVDYTANGSKTTLANLNKTRTEYSWSQGTRFGMARSNGDYNWNVLQSPSGEFANYTFGDGTLYTAILYHNDTKNSTYPITAMTMLREDADGDDITLGSNGRITSGQYYTYLEIEIDKDRLLDFYNGMYDDSEKFASLPETMLFSLQQMETDTTSPATAYIWNGSFDDDHASKEHALMAYNYDKVIFKASASEEASVDTTSYYHSCTECGLAADNVFKVDENNNLVYDTKTIYDVSTTDFEDDVAPTCESRGNYIYSCTCNELDPDLNTFEVDALGHDDDSFAWVIGTGELEGKHWAVCDVCDNDSTTSVPYGTEAHTHDYTLENPDDKFIVNASFIPVCTEGKKYYKSCECGDFLTTNEIFEDVDSRNLNNHWFSNNPNAVLVDDDSVGHYFECGGCKGIGNFSYHEFDNDNDTVCDECGYERYVYIPGGVIGGEVVGGETSDTNVPVDTTVPEETTSSNETGSVDTDVSTETEEKSTNAPVTEPTVNSNQETDEDMASGNTSCEGTVTFTGLVIVSILGLAAAVVEKKKEEY